MSMWPSRTKLWGGKTRSVGYIKEKKDSMPNGHDTRDEDFIEEHEDYMEEQDKIKHLEAHIISLETRLKEKCQEIVGLQIQLKENTQFMQTVVLELIQMKRPIAQSDSSIKPKGALENYIANKNSKEVAKLP